MARSVSARDPTVVAIPLYFATMAAEHLVLRRRADLSGPTPGNYERRDTLTSLTMGVMSLVSPLIAPKLLRPFTPGRGRFGRAVAVTAVGAAAATTAGDIVWRRAKGSARIAEAARAVASVGGVTATVAGAVGLATAWQSRTSLDRLWRRRLVRGLGPAPLAAILATLGWDFIYYWNHRFMHECRYMWAIHVVHHSSEHYNLSTALRQPVLESLATPIPYGALCLLGVSPRQIETARAINLLYQYWIHTETIGKMGPVEVALNTPSLHRVHHGSNQIYLDRNHGSILILWDRLFGTHQPETERVVYGLTKNIHTFNIATVATHEFVSILKDVAASTTWRERISYVVRGPGWADRHRFAQVPQ